MKKIIIFICCLTITISCFSQNEYIYLKNNKYPASEKIKLQNNVYNFVYLNVKLGINGNAGLLELSFETGDHDLIVGEIQIFLDNGNYIKCIDYGYRDLVGRESSNIFRLTAKEMEYLSKHTVTKIRYTVGDYNQDFSYMWKKTDYFAINDYSRAYRSNELVHVNTAKIFGDFINKNSINNQKHDYNALFGSATNTNVNQEKKIKNASIITLKPNHVEAGRKYGNKREPEVSGQINSMTVEFSRDNVKIYDGVEQSNFKVVSYEWITDNKLWIDFSSKPLEFYMVIVFDIDGLVFVNNENDPQPGEEYKSLYFKELSRRDFKYIYK